MATLHASTYEHIQWSTIIQSRNKQCQWEMKPRFASAVHGDHRVVSTNPTREPPLILTQTLSTPTTSTLPKKKIKNKNKTLKKKTGTPDSSENQDTTHFLSEFTSQREGTAHPSVPFTITTTPTQAGGVPSAKTTQRSLYTKSVKWISQFYRPHLHKVQKIHF